MAGLREVLLGGLGLLGYGIYTTDPSRAEALPSYLAQGIVWTACVASLVLRTPGQHLRVGDPGVVLFGWLGYYFIVPAIEYLKGGVFLLESEDAIRLDPAIVSRTLYGHCLFMVMMVAGYHVLCPKERPRALTAEEVHRLPSGTLLLVLGAAPFLNELVTRIMTTGSIRPTAAYGDYWMDLQDRVTTSRNLGGTDFFLIQVMAKVWYLPMMALGVGLGLRIARHLVRRQWGALVALHLLLPLMMYLSLGGRSAVMAPYMIAVIVADLLVGPVPRAYILAMLLGGSALFEFYGSFRAYQSESLSVAMTSTLEVRDAGREGPVSTETSSMLVKDAYAQMYSDVTARHWGLVYFPRSVMQLLPLQLVPEKATWVSGSAFLSEALLGHAALRAGSGVAGSMYADGHMILGFAGVGLLSVVVGLLVGAMVRWLLGGASRVRGPPVWKLGLLACFCAQLFWCVRGDLSALLATIVHIILPVALVWRAISNPDHGSPWWYASETN